MRRINKAKQIMIIIIIIIIFSLDMRKLDSGKNQHKYNTQLIHIHTTKQIKCV